MLFACCHDIVDTMLIAKSSFSETLRFTSAHAHFLKSLTKWACAEVKRKQKKIGAEILHKHHQHAIHTNSDGDRWDATAMEVAGICWDSEIEIARIN